MFLEDSCSEALDARKGGMQSLNFEKGLKINMHLILMQIEQVNRL